MFRGLILNEWSKLIHKRRFLIAMGILLVFVIYYFGVVYANISPPRDSAEVERQILANIAKMNKDLAKAKLGSKEAAEITEQMEVQQLELEKMAATKIAQWQPVLKKEIRLLEQRLSVKQANDSRDILTWEYEKLAADRYLLNKNIAPEWMYGEQPGAFAGVKSFFFLAAPLFFPLLVVFLVADIVSGEMADGTVKLLLTRPPGRWKILTAKYLTTVTATIALVMLTTLLTLAFGGLLFGFHDYNQPEVGLKYYQTEKTLNGSIYSYPVIDTSRIKVYPQWLFVIKSAGLAILPLITVATVTFAASVIFNSPLAVMGGMMGLLIGSSFIPGRVAGGYMLASFTSYLRLPLLLKTGYPIEDLQLVGRLIEKGAKGVSMSGAVGVLAAYCLVSLVVAYYVFKRREILV